MKKAILATKVGMTQIFNEDGVLTPVTVLQAGPCVVTQIKTVENDGYSAVQVGFGDKRESLVNKPMKGQFSKAGVSCKRFVREFKFENAEDYKVADEIKADIFAAGDRLMLLQFPKVRDSRVRSRDMVSTEDRWLMVLNSIVIRVQTVLAPIRAVYSKEKECLDRWETRESPSRTWKS